MIRKLAGLGTAAVACMIVQQSSGVAASASAVINGQPDVVNTLDYLLITHGVTLNGTHPLSQTVVGHKIYDVLWDSDAYETYSYDDNYIYLSEDHGGGETAQGSYTFSDARWMKRTMAVGDQIVASTNSVQYFTPDGSSCAPTNSSYFPYVMSLEQHIPQDNLGGTLGTQDVIILKYDYRWGTGTDYEKFYFAKGWGMVKWEDYHNGQVTHSSTFDTVTNTPPTAPNLANACLGTPVTSAVPQIPTSLSGFVRMMYKCILGTSNLDAPSVNYWVGQLQSGAVSIEGAYADFFAYNSADVTNDNFIKNVYNCALFHAVDSASEQTQLTDLQNGIITRTQLVQAVLRSQEFAMRGLPLLRQLQYPVPQMPTSLNGLVNTLYSCAMGNKAPGTANVDYWVGLLKSGTVSIPAAITQFFKSQPSSFSNGDFAITLYDCPLFRSIDPVSDVNVLQALQSGSFTRAGLVQSILSSSEFTGTVLPQLQKLS